MPLYSRANMHHKANIVHDFEENTSAKQHVALERGHPPVDYRARLTMYDSVK